MVSEDLVHHNGEDMAEQSSSNIIVSRKQRKGREEGTRVKLPARTHSSSLLPPARLYLLKFPDLPKLVSPPGL
jgi:hypothetical protein